MEIRTPVFFDLITFSSALLERSPAVAILSWTRISTLQWFVDSVGRELRKSDRHILCSKLWVAELDRQSFAEKLTKTLSRPNAAKTCLVIFEIEPLAGSVGAILNGFRERLGVLRALVLCIRENRRRDLFLECPDLLDWSGPMTGSIEDMGPPLTKRNVEKAIQGLEKRHGINSAEFVKQSGNLTAAELPDAWEWTELLSLQAALEKGRN